MPCARGQLIRLPLDIYSGHVYGTREKGDKRLPYIQLAAEKTDVAADICVVGSGAGGAIAASRLARPGVKVVVLESGSYVDAVEFDQKEANMLPLLFKDGGAQLTMDFSMTVAQGRCLGGSTVINDAICFPPPEPVLEEWVEKTGVDGLSWSSLRPHVEKIWSQLGVAQVPPSQIKGHNLKLKQGCDALGIVKHAPNFRNCHDCCECGVCHLGCAYDTKRSMLVTAIPEALKNGAEIYCDCEAWKIVFRGNRAVKIEASMILPGGRDERLLTVTAKTFVIAAGTIASSGLLRRSRSRWKSPLGRKLPVGRGVALHPSPLVMGIFPDEVNAHEAIPMAYHCREFSAMNNVVQGGFMLESIFLPPMQLAAAMPSVGNELWKDMSQYRRISPIGILIRDRPTGEVRLGFQDEAVLDYKVGPPEAATLGKAMVKATQILFAAGARRVLTSHRARVELRSAQEADVILQHGAGNDTLWMGSAHPQGGNPMGSDPGKSVVDGDGLVHGTSNLYVCDASVFPSAIGVNPQITVMALADKIATRLLQ